MQDPTKEILESAVKISDDDRINLFFDVRAGRNHIGIIPEIVSDITEGGIIKPHSAIEDESKNLSVSNAEGALVGVVGEVAIEQDILPGDRVFINLMIISNPLQSIEREGVVVLFYDVQHVVGIIPIPERDEEEDAEFISAIINEEE